MTHSPFLWLVVSVLVTLVILVILRVRTDVETKDIEIEKSERLNTLAKDVHSMSERGDVLAKDVRLISLVSRHVALDCLKDNPTLRAQLIEALESDGAVCADCPLRNSSLCGDCGREVVNERAKV